MTAEEARHTMLARNQEIQDSETFFIKDRINDAIHFGETYIVVNFLHENTIQMLKDKGYKVKFKLGPFFSSPHWRISWK